MRASATTRRPIPLCRSTLCFFGSAPDMLLPPDAPDRWHFSTGAVSRGFRVHNHAVRLRIRVREETCADTQPSELIHTLDRLLVYLLSVNAGSFISVDI